MSTGVLLAALALELTGCAARPAAWPELGTRSERQQRRQQRDPSIQIVPQSNREVADLSPDDIVQIMRRIGFTDQHIVDLGTDLRDALLLSGAARVLHKEQTVALIAVNGAQVYIGSGSRGNFIYDLSYGQFVEPGAPR